ncbi:MULTISPECIES: hypothetical protein [Halomicrobium]|uniref:Uncharacterized protein n=2 Tax=Halomicrobium mukohataei TaxID=57705 RepID=C7P126_HALMD|nr:MULTISPECIES: hypothetical protein [Halomicrobium]ACV49041.1 hypothetical protein Hmuk_2936 [Halomicrobium mukohataei DSM 12286]QCD64461.1 hypothetical protein E5139_01960 [Halomicrobium mukohataei]QFR19267.1 hypothetical protein GBQ70_01960 [Halomicrobium sp. ZPS1]
MVSAPTTRSGWVAFAGSMMVLYAAILLPSSTINLVDSLVLGAFYGLSMAVSVALLVVLWRGLPDLLYRQSVA